jgi:hypothetical protein
MIKKDKMVFNVNLFYLKQIKILFEVSNGFLCLVESKDCEQSLSQNKWTCPFHRVQQ